jgi:PD-(D/E)XK endonuclease
MKKNGIEPKHSKLRGELAELRFMTRAAEHGLRMIKPWGDTSRYDFVVETGGKFVRVQVKSTSIHPGNHFVCPLGRARQRSYRVNDFDFLAVYIVPIDTWYIIPIKVVCRHKKGIGLSPHNSLSKHAAYKEAWHLLGGE